MCPWKPFRLETLKRFCWKPSFYSFMYRAIWTIIMDGSFIGKIFQFNVRKPMCGLEPDQSRWDVLHVGDVSVTISASRTRCKLFRCDIFFFTAFCSAGKDASKGIFRQNPSGFQSLDLQLSLEQRQRPSLDRHYLYRFLCRLLFCNG